MGVFSDQDSLLKELVPGLSNAVQLNFSGSYLLGGRSRIPGAIWRGE
jgi:hypothetical protein